jgi:hypothetical protein
MKKGTKRTGWTPKRRAEQSARTKQQKPWLKATGPNTPEGKFAVSQNALKHGFRSAEFRLLCQALTAQARFVKSLTNDSSLRGTK